MRYLVTLRQLRAALMRWTMVLVLGILLLGYLSEAMGGIAGKGAHAGVWFAGLARPAGCPSLGTLALVWDICFVLMGLGLAVIVEARGARGRGVAIAVFALQMVVSLGWAPVCFGMHRIGWAFGLLCLLALLIMATIVLFYRVRGRAGVLLVPYLVWVIFLAVLTWQLLTLNPAAAEAPGSTPAVRLQIGA